MIKSLKTVCWIWPLLAGSGSVFGSASTDSGNIMFWRIPDEIWRDLDSYILKIHQVVKKIVMRSILALIFKILANMSMLLLSLKMEAAKNLDFLTKCSTSIACLYKWIFCSCRNFALQLAFWQVLIGLTTLI